MAHKIVKLQAFSAIILLGLLAIPFLTLPSGTTQPPAQFDIAGDDRESPSSAAAFDLDADYLQSYLASVLDRAYNFSRDTETAHELDGTYYHLMESDWSAPVGGTKDKYSYDNILTYFGLWGMQLGSLNPEVVEMFDSNVRNTKLYTKFNESTYGSTGAFRSNMDRNGTTYLNDTYRLDDNALALLGLLQFEESSTAGDLAEYLWNYLNNSLWHSDSVDYKLNYFLDTNGTIQTQAKSYLNLLGALVCSMVARSDSPFIDGIIKQQAAFLAQRAFSALNYSSVFAEIGFTGDYCFIKEYGEKQRFLTANALGIATLADFYLRSGRAEANRSALTQAETLYRVIEKYFYDTTWGYVYQVEDDGDQVSQTSLEGNAFWLLALGRLFEASGNITYYEKAVEVYQKVVANLWDSTNLGFNLSKGIYGTDPTKSVGQNALFYLALQEIDQAYRKTTLTLTKSNPELVILENPVLNITCQYNLTWALNSYTINQPVSAANVTLNLYYLENGTFIKEIINYTNVYGNRTILHTLTGLPLGDYVIYAHANRTGFGVAYATSYFSIVSNMSRTAIDPTIRVVQGESTEFNIMIDNKRNNDTLVSCSGIGTDLTIGAPSFLLANHTVTNRTFQITAGQDAPLGIQEVTLKLVNNSINIFETQVQVEVLPAVSFQYIEFSRTIVAGIEGEVFIVLENARPTTQESVTVTLRSADLQAYTQSISLQPNERVKIYVPLNYTGTFITGIVNFEVNVSRHSQIVQSAIYTSKLASAIEVQSMSTSTRVLQGRSYFLNLRAVNNVNDTQQVDLYINGQLAKEGIVLAPGQNDLILPLNPLTYNPWDLTTYTLNVTLKAGSETVFQNRLFVQSIPSIENILFFWVLPLVFPIACLLIFLQKQKKQEMLR